MDLKAHWRLAALAVVCTLIGVSATRAQEPSKSSIAVAREVLFAKGATGAFDPVVRGVVEKVRLFFLPTNPNLTNELNEVSRALQKEFEPKRNELIDVLARDYAVRFTEQELKEILVFYRTPLGQKWAKEEPIAIEAGFRDATEWSNRLSDVVIVRFRAEMQKKGHSL
jgi:uncharacterized protein